MTYKLKSDLKWLPARGIVVENNFSNVVAPSQKDSLNPNGLFSGFSCEGIFYTSRWTGTKFVEHSFPVKEIVKYSPLETETLEQEKPKPTKEEVKKPSILDGFKIQPNIVEPYPYRNPFSDINIYKNFPVRGILSEGFEKKISENNKKLFENNEQLFSELSSIFGLSEKKDK